MNNSIKKILYLSIDIFLILGTVPFLNKLDNGISNAFINAHSLIYYIVVYFCLLIFIGSFIKGDKKFALPLSVLILFVYIYIQSAIFSSSVIDSIMKVTVLLGTCLYALSLIKRYKFDDILIVGMMVSLVINLVTIIVIILEPNIVYEGYKDQLVLSGSFPTKNNFATYMLFSMIINLTYFKNGKKAFFKYTGLLLFIISTVFLFWSGSATSLVTVLIIIFVYIACKLKNNKLNVVNISLLINIFVYFFVLISSAFNTFFINLIGRDLTFTGRVYIWDAIITQAAHGLVFGYGYGTFWGYNALLEQSIISNYSRLIGGVTVSGSHNGFLELFLQIGIIGTAIFIGILIISGNKLKSVKDKSLFQFSSFYLVYILIYFITERSLWNMGYQTLFLFIIILTLSNISSKNQC